MGRLRDWPAAPHPHRPRMSAAASPQIKMRHTYLVTVPDYEQSCGTCISTHYLVHLINDLTPAKAYAISQSPTDGTAPKRSRGFRTPTLADPRPHLPNAIVVYIQNPLGYNPWNAVRFVHWALYWPDRTGLLPTAYPPEGATMCYHSGYCDSVSTDHPVMRLWEPEENPPVLTVVNIPREMQDLRRPNRTGSGYIVNSKHRCVPG